MNVKWIDAKSLLEEGDILLFRAKTHPFALNYWIALYTRSIYSHVSLVSLSGGQISCVEFREWVGSRRHPLIEEIQRGEKIDVYRICSSIQTTTFSGETRTFSTQKLEFNSETAKNITNYAESLINQKIGYSWSIIARFVMLFIPFLRLVGYNNIDVEDQAFVCSTLVSRAYRKYYCDLVKNLPDHMTSPADIARSGLITYLFSIEND